MVTVLVTGYSRNGSGRIEIIKENNRPEVCKNMPKYSVKISVAAGTYWNNDKLSIYSDNIF